MSVPSKPKLYQSTDVSHGHDCWMTKNVKDQKWGEERQTKYKTVKTTTWSKNVFENTSFEMTDETANNTAIPRKH